MSCEFPIGVFDSGLGGISVLRELKKQLPSESFVYFADRENAPYGTRSDGEIQYLVQNAVGKLLHYDCKAIVLACNTATSVTAELLRNKYDIPIIGLEPAIKPAIKKYPNGSVLVLATPVTLEHKKFINLLSELNGNNVCAVAAPKLVSFVENDTVDTAECALYLRDILSRYECIKFDACVLGCTHFPYAKNAIITALGYTPEFFDGAVGAAHHLKSILISNGITSRCAENGYVVWLSSRGFEQQRRFLYNKK